MSKMSETTNFGLRRQVKLNRRMVLLGAIPTGVMILAFIFWLFGGRYVSTDNAYVSAPQLQISSQVEGTVSGVLISDVEVRESPDWLKKKLASIGVKAINNIVDVTNFVLHETGQPLHAFDADEISGNKVIVKNLSEGTSFTTLDEKEIKLKAGDVMIFPSVFLYPHKVAPVTKGVRDTFVSWVW